MRRECSKSRLAQSATTRSSFRKAMRSPRAAPFTPSRSPSPPTLSRSRSRRSARSRSGASRSSSTRAFPGCRLSWLSMAGSTRASCSPRSRRPRWRARTNRSPTRRASTACRLRRTRRTMSAWRPSLHAGWATWPRTAPASSRSSCWLRPRASISAHRSRLRRGCRRFTRWSARAWASTLTTAISPPTSRPSRRLWRQAPFIGSRRDCCPRNDGMLALLAQLGAVPEVLERLGIGQRLQVLHRPAMHHVAHRQLDDLPALGARDVFDLQDLGRDVPRGGVLADPALDCVDERIVERAIFAQLDEQHDPHVARPVLPDHQRLDDLLQLLDLAVDLRGADAHAAGVQHRVGAAMDDDAAARRDLAPVALAPDVRVLGEVRGAVPGAVGVVPEAHRHRGKGPGADQLSLLVAD